MRYYYFEDDDWKTWRFWCECGEIGHAFEIRQSPDHPKCISLLIVNSPYQSLWQRIKNACSLIFNNWHFQAEVFIDEKDFEEIAGILLDRKIINAHGPNLAEKFLDNF